jgi:hypothetical protein
LRKGAVFGFGSPRPGAAARILFFASFGKNFAFLRENRKKTGFPKTLVR